MRIAVAGAGAFGAALAAALAGAGREVTLWGRDAAAMAALDAARASPRLPGATLPAALRVTADPAALDADAALLAVPAQALRAFLAEHGERLAGRPAVTCCKGLDLATLDRPSALVARAVPGATPAVLTGPSFAADLARGRPTALLLACADADAGTRLQAALSTPVLRLYRSADLAGAELGGALKNVVAIACGACIGAGYGESARAALLARGFAEMVRLALALGAEADTLGGLAGLGDLVLTATSDGSRNFRHGLHLGRGEAPEAGQTVEGVATARAAAALGAGLGIEMPVTEAVAALCDGRLDAAGAMRRLLDRPLREE